MHWYDIEGNPYHTIIGKNGKERATTLRDARQLRLFPSVTTIMSIQDKPALTQWLINELMEAAIIDPYHPYEWEVDNWKKHVSTQMRKKSREAADRGTELHNKLEDYFKTGQICKKDASFIIPAITLIEETFPNKKWIAEQRFCDSSIGYAGSVDLHCEDIVIDFKTKDKKDLKDMIQYDDHRIQLAAYQYGLKKLIKRRFNLFISTNKETPGLCKLVECTDIDRYWSIFRCLNKLWQLKNNYNPSEVKLWDC